MLKQLVAAAFALVIGAGQATAQGLIRDAEIERTLSMLSNPIFEAAGLRPDTVDMFILNNRDLNAFVFGGQNMVFHTGLLTRLKTPEGLIGVIAHETGHITGNHLQRRQIAADSLRGPAAAGVLLAIIAAAASGQAEVGAAGALTTQSTAERLLLAFNRSEEAAADQAGATYMERAGVSPGGLLESLEIFRGQEVFSAGRRDPYVRTHPLSSERLALLRRRVDQSSARDGRVSDELRYWHARMRAKLSAFLDRPTRTLNAISAAGDPDSEINTLRRAIALHRAPEPEAALAAVNDLLKIRPGDAYYHELKGQFLFESGRAADAVAPLRHAVSLAPDEALIRGALGRALLSLGDPASDKEALETLEAVRADVGADTAVLRDLALAYARAGDEGNAALATAERFLAQGGMKDSLRHARHAMAKLPRGGPAWLRADEIRSVAERAQKAK